ncbi:MAG: chemotaxis protein CheW [Pseudomonadota bacterium]|nr:chemotaxis protein CheW [Pseudomonadota bacterium]
MLVLFTLDGDRYGIPVRDVVEITPLVRLKKLPLAPPWVAGLFNYRGGAIPVLDICRLAGAAPCRSRLGTRIIVVRYPQTAAGRPLGVIAEQVTETVRLDEADFAPAGLRMEEAPFLGQVAVLPQGIIQRVEVAGLLPENLRRSLFAQAEAAS